MALNPKQEMFCLEYIKDLNASQAYIRAGYSEKGANVAAFKLLTNANVQEKIQELKKDRSEKIKVDAEYLLKKIVEVIDNGEEKTADQLKAIEMAGKHIGFYEAHNDQKKPDPSVNTKIAEIYLTPDPTEEGENG